MGILNSFYKKTVYDDISYNITSNSSNYYVFAANPVACTGNVLAVTADDYSTNFYNTWSMIFGKKLGAGDILPIIDNIQWTSNTVYARYDDRNEILYLSNTSFYVICPPDVSGGNYNIFKCIDNANGAPSTSKPSTISPSSFTTADGYKWRYITSLSTRTYEKFSTDDYSPIMPNTYIVESSQSYAGVEVVMITNGGIGYSTYHNGNVVSVISSNLIQIETGASSVNNFYTKGAVYIYNDTSPTSEIFGITRYISNTSGKWLSLDGYANTSLIEPGTTRYRIAPKVYFTTDGDNPPSAYCTVNSTSNSIDTVVMIDTGSNIRRANVEIQANNIHGSGANLYAIVPPPDGHGHDPATELGMVGMGIGFLFANTERNSIITSNTLYNKIGIIKDPYDLDQSDGSKAETFFSNNTFNQLLSANVGNSSVIFTSGHDVIGANSLAVGTVVFANSTIVYLTGDKTFIDGEVITSTNNFVNSTISINTRGAIYAKDIFPIYSQNINNVNRSNTQTESFKLIIKI